MKKRLLTRRKDRAVILLLVLWIVVVLSLFAYSILFSTTTETTITAARKRQMQAEALARAGLAKAIADLRNDMIFDSAENAKVFDAEGDVWARPEEGRLEQRLDRQNENAHFTTRVYDEERYFNLNRMSATNMIIIQKIAEQIGYEEEDAKFVAAAIVDWRDTDQTPAIENPPAQAEGIVYAMLMAEDRGERIREDEVEPVVLRNEDFLSVNELLEVYGVTPELFFGPGSAEAEFYREQFADRYANVDRFQIRERRRSRSDDGPVLGLRDYFTVYGNGTLNINTAPEWVLSALVEASGNPDGDRYGERIVRNRRRGRSEDIDNSAAYKEMSEVMADREVAGILTVANALYPVGVQSTVFRVESIGEVDGVKSRITALLHRNLLNLQRNEDFDTIRRAEERQSQYASRSNRREDRSNTSLVRYPAVRVMQFYIE